MPSALVNRGGDEVEAVVAMLLCRRFERAARRRPGQGDQGVDVWVPVGDGRVDVYQVKRHDKSINTSQWAKVRDSYETLVQAVTDGHLQVRNWYLTLPLDASEKDETRFAELTAGSPFELCEWKGLAWLDALAAEFPSVIDYYLGDGKARLDQSYRDLMAVLGARDAANSGQDAAATSAGLKALYRTLNSHDPLYRYDFAVGAPTDQPDLAQQKPPGSLVFSAQVVTGDVAVTWHVHARCDESVRERPIPIGLTFDVKDNPALRESLRLFADYGKPFDAPDDSATVNMDLPGGFGGATDTRGSVQVGPAATDTARAYVLRMRATRGHKDPVVVRLEMNTPTVGRGGARLFGTHDGGAFTFEAFHNFETTAMQGLRFAQLELTGKPVEAVLPGVEFLVSLHESTLEIAAERGPFRPFAAVATFIDATGSPAPPDPGLAALRALHQIQQHTSTEITVPDFTVVTVAEVAEWANIARILRGETVADPRLGTLTHQSDSPPPQSMGDNGAVIVVINLIAVISGQRLVVGKQALHVACATINTDPADPTRHMFTPWEGHTWTRTLSVEA